jgi:hypothetical protein
MIEDEAIAMKKKIQRKESGSNDGMDVYIVDHVGCPPRRMNPR